MAYRTTAGQVQGVLMSDYGAKADGTLPSLEPFIRPANAIVSRLAVAATAKGITLSTAELREIETWLAAHCYCLSDRAIASETTERSSATYQGKTGMRLEATLYGQMALSLDPSGCLQGLTSGRRASLAWGGMTESEQSDYVDRMQ
jgi:hypothetical protein